MANAFNLGGQTACYHDECDESGYFHTFDALQLEPSDQPCKVHVFLPRSYDDHQSYPVVFMNSEVLERQYGYVLGKDLFKYEDKKGGHDEREWSYRLGLLLKQFYKTM